MSLLLLSLLAGCATEPGSAPNGPSPAAARKQIASLLPPGATDRNGWATDIYAAFATLGLPANTGNFCSVIAVIDQESSFRSDPSVPGLPAIAWREIDRRADSAGVPAMLVHAALQLRSPDGRTYSERIDTVKTERQLSDIFDDFIGMVPMGRRFFAQRNPIRTGGPMQVSITFAESQAAARPYPYPITDSIRHEVFTRRGGVYFGVAHLLDYPAPYSQPLYRFADFNAGRYASRNAAFQNALSVATGVPLALDGDLLRFDDSGDQAGSTEIAARTLATRLDMSANAIHEDLAQGKLDAFERTRLYRQVFELADRLNGSRLPRAIVPHIDLQGPKITRHLTTEWYASRVDARRQRCIAREQRAD